MTDQQPHTSHIEEVCSAYVQYHHFNSYGMDDSEETEKSFYRMIARIEAAAEQRGEVKAFRKTQEIIAGFEHTIDEERERGDMINTGYLIQEIDTEIQDLMEGDDD